MSTDYDLYVKAPDFPESRDLVDLLEAYGATGATRILNSGFPDRWQVDLDDLGTCDVFNERQSREGTVFDDVPQFEYDFCITVWVPFSEDNVHKRAAVMRLAQALALSFPVVVSYNGDTLAVLAQGGLVEKFEEKTPYVVEGVAESPAIQLLENMGFSRKGLGVPDA